MLTRACGSYGGCLCTPQCDGTWNSTFGNKLGKIRSWGLELSWGFSVLIRGIKQLASSPHLCVCAPLEKRSYDGKARRWLLAS